MIKLLISCTIILVLGLLAGPTFPQDVDGGDTLVLGEQQRFHFETASDDLSVALQRVYAAYITTPSPELDMIVLEHERQMGISYLRTFSEGVFEALHDEASRWEDPLDRGRLMSIFHLMGYLNSNNAVEYLFAQAKRSVSEQCNNGEEYCSDAYTLRLDALYALGRTSANGNALAREKVLDLLEYDEDRLIQRKAVGIFYDTGGMSRWRAKREMKKRLPESKHYLLHETY